MLGARPGPAQPLNALLLALDLTPSTFPRSGFVHGREAAVDEAAAKVASERRLHILSDVREFGLRGLIDVPRWAVADACRPGQSAKQLDDVLRYGSISRNLKVA